ncbi:MULTISPECIES: MFS transporter [Arthrobacter]|uniref:MFS transporter n=1 Tax=Arthrobacter terricola TaxID=2547396 RepID=A0A4R5KZI8_9MICC|nr:MULTISPECIES: MFS transporter [Arthrobacter]MBT8158864.1 MFS transporter [Arthrobacter sp. GN70]TDG01548.1 MFS transporter [Arthrobacter terricola]
MTAGTTRTDQAAASLWRDKNFITFWSGQAVSQLGAQLGQLAFPVLAVALLSASEFEVGALNAAGLAAFLVIGLPAGAWVDRWLKRRTMMLADLVRTVAMASVPVLWWSGVLQMWHLYVVSAVVGAATVFFDVSYQSYVPVLVDAAKVPQANSKLEATSQIARIGGPAAGGALLAVVSAPVLFVGEAAGYLLSAVFLFRTRDAEQRIPTADRRPLGSEIKEGLAFVAKHPLISRIAACTAGVNFFTTIAFTLMPILVLRELELGPQGMGLIMAVGAVGGLIGAVAAPRFAAWTGEGTAIPVASIISSVFLLLVPLSVFAPERWMSLVMLIVSDFGFGFGVLVYNIMQLSMRQRVCPPRLLGRMNASIRFVVWGVMPISALASGLLAESLGLVPTLWIALAGSVLSVAPVLFSPLMGMRTLPDAVHHP